MVVITPANGTLTQSGNKKYVNSTFVSMTTSQSLFTEKVNDDDSQINYFGSWSNGVETDSYHDQRSYSNITNDYVEFTFREESIKWIGTKGSNHGKAKIYIDGVLLSTVDTFNATGVEQAVLFSQSNLTDDLHTIKVEVTNQKHQQSSDYYVTVDAFEYEYEKAVPNIFEDSDAAVNYEGTWNSRSNASAHRSSDHHSNVTDSYVEFTFIGSSIRLIGSRGSNHGMADIYIDGVLETTDIDFYGANPEYQKVIYGKSGLKNGTHTIKVVVAGMKNDSSSDYHIVIDGFEAESAVYKIDDTSTDCSYNGTWYTRANSSAYNSSDSYTNVANSTVELTFNGTEISWIGSTGSNHGIAKIYIDATYMESVDCYNATGSSQSVLYKLTGLTDAQHTIKV